MSALPIREGSRKGIAVLVSGSASQGGTGKFARRHEGSGRPQDRAMWSTPPSLLVISRRFSTGAQQKGSTAPMDRPVDSAGQGWKPSGHILVESRDEIGNVGLYCSISPLP
jgi:hypothetical protein